MQAFNDEPRNVVSISVKALRKKIDVALLSTCKPNEKEEEERGEGEEEGAFFMVCVEEKKEGSKGEEVLSREGDCIAYGNNEPDAKCKGPKEGCKA